MNDFKKLNQIIFDNIRINGMYEWKLKPIELIVVISFSFNITEMGLNISPNEFKEHIRNKFNLFSIDKSCKFLNVFGNKWKYNGARFAFEHNIDAICQKKGTSSLTIDLWFLSIKNVTNDDIDNFFKKIGQKLAKLHNFQSTDFISIFYHRKNAKNAKNKNFTRSS